MVTIIEGCNKNCTFCIVPQTRGPERSRRLDEILAEVRHLLDYGFQEIELLGQTVNHWREPGGDPDFADLLRAVGRSPGLRRLALRHLLSPRLHDRMASRSGHATICPISTCRSSRAPTPCCAAWGGDTPRRVSRTSAAPPARVPGLALSTDLIVGFPGETEEDFQQTLDLLGGRLRRRLRLHLLAAARDRRAPRQRRRRPTWQPERLPRALRPPGASRSGSSELNDALVGKDFDVDRRAQAAGHPDGRTTCHRVVHFQVGSEPAPCEASPGARPAALS